MRAAGEAASVVIAIQEAVPPSLNTYTRLHYHAKTRLRNLWRELLSYALDAKRQQDKQLLMAWAEEKIPVNIDILVARRRLLDNDNLWGGVKPVLDALKVSPQGLGWIADDSAAMCKLKVMQVKSQQQSTEIAISPRGA